MNILNKNYALLKFIENFNEFIIRIVAINIHKACSRSIMAPFKNIIIHGEIL